jgi:hypothetical protein
MTHDIRRDRGEPLTDDQTHAADRLREPARRRACALVVRTSGAGHHRTTRSTSAGTWRQAAIDWAHGSDQRNADLVERTRHLADLQVTLPEA